MNFTNEPAKVSVNLEDAECIRCDNCESAVFKQSYVLRKVSALLSPTGKEVVVPVNIMQCSECEHVNEGFVPAAIWEDLQNGESNPEC